MLSIRTFSFLSLIIFITVAPPGAAQSGSDTIQWLTEASFDLETSDPDQAIQGIPFGNILADIRMVMAGEATHGTKEFAEIKHRLFRHLVEQLDFRYFLIEADFGAGLSVDQYICGEGGDPEEALRGLRYFHIVNKEGLALINWMKSYNDTRRPEDKIRFFGIDCQTSEDAFARLKDYFRAVDPAYYREIAEITLRDYKVDGSKTVLDKKYPVLTLSKDTIEMFKTQLALNKISYIQASSDSAYKIAVRLSVHLTQSFEIATGDEGYRMREEYMAKNADWVLHEIAEINDKAFLWAHNGHVVFSEITDARTGASFGTLGSLIRKNLDNRVYSIGLDFNRGSFIANEVKYDTIVKKVWTLENVSENEFLRLLSRTGLNALFMDFNSIQNKNLENWLARTTLRGHNIGAVFYPDYRLRRYIWPRNFDGLIFINDTNAISLIPKR